MFIGHYSASFVAATHPKAPGLGTLFVAAQLVDYGFFSLMLANVEHMRLVPGITAMNAMDLYDMPWTHSLAGAAGWALAFAALIGLVTKRWTAAAIAGAVVLSHWLIDLLVHRPDLTLAGSPPPMGLGLWNHPAIEIPLELAFAYGGLAWFVFRTRARSRSGLISPAILALAMAGCQAYNWLVAPETLTPAVPLSGLAAYSLLALLAWWTGANRELRT
jgi:hypothetical protein